MPIPESDLPSLIDYIKNRPILATLETMLRPEFTYRHNARDLLLRVLMQFCLMGKADAVTALDSQKDLLEQLYPLFNQMAVGIDDSPDNHEKIAALKQLKKHIHAYAEFCALSDGTNRKRIVNLKKLLERNSEEDKSTLSAYLNEDKLTSVYVAVECDVSALFSTQAQEEAQKRQTAKSRINKASLLVSVIVAIGEAAIAAAFATATLPFLPALLAVGIPALLCNYFLFRNASFSVMKDIYFGKSSDSKATKALKLTSTFFSAAAGLAYGFLSYGSTAMAFGHLFFGLTAAAALSCPPVGLIVLSIVIAGATAVAVSTLYDHAIRGIISKGLKEPLQKLKANLIQFFSPDNGKSFHALSKKEQALHIAKKCVASLLHFAFYATALAVSVVVILTILPIMKHRGSAILRGTFKVAHAAASKVSLAITIGMGSLVNGFFYAKQVFGAMNIVKSVALAALHPQETARKISAVYKSATANVYTTIQTAVTSIKRFFLFGSVVMNSVVGQGMGASKSPQAQNMVHHVIPDEPVAQASIASSLSMASGMANANGVYQGTRNVSAAFFKPAVVKPESKNAPTKCVNSTSFFSLGKNVQEVTAAKLTFQEFSL